MFVTELDSFVSKFQQLWSAGYSAHLDLDSHAGEAWVGLRVWLGHAPPGHLHHPPSTHPTLNRIIGSQTVLLGNPAVTS